jgi:hypothetical protein
MGRYLPTANAKQNISSDIQPWGLEFLRFDQILKASDDLAIQVRMYNDESIHQYWVVLYQLYMMMRPYMASGTLTFFKELNKTTRTQHDDWEEDVKNGYKETPKELIKQLTQYHEAILKAKHFVGLGIPMSENFNPKKKMKNALLGKDSK